MKRIALIAAGWLMLTAAAPAPSAGQAPAAQTQPAGDSLGADWGTQQDEVRANVRQGRYIPLARAIEIVRQRSPGHQLDAGIEQWNGRAVSGAILRADGG